MFSCTLTTSLSFWSDLWVAGAPRPRPPRPPRPPREGLPRLPKLMSTWQVMSFVGRRQTRSSSFRPRPRSLYTTRMAKKWICANRQHICNHLCKIIQNTLRRLDLWITTALGGNLVSALRMLNSAFGRLCSWMAFHSSKDISIATSITSSASTGLRE